MSTIADTNADDATGFTQLLFQSVAVFDFFKRMAHRSPGIELQATKCVIDYVLAYKENLRVSAKDPPIKPLLRNRQQFLTLGNPSKSGFVY